MHARSVRKLILSSALVGLCCATNAISKSSALEMKQQYLTQIKRPTAEMKNHSGESMRSLYVARLAELDSSVLDADMQTLFADLMEKDDDEWVRLEAVGQIAYIPLADDKLARVTGLLEKYRSDERVNFQVLAAQSLLAIGKKKKTTNVQAEKTLAKIAQGQGMAQWKIMIPPHNVGTTIADPTGKAQIPFEDFYRQNMRRKAIFALSIPKDDFSKKVLSDLTKDSDAMISETAKSCLAH